MLTIKGNRLLIEPKALETEKTVEGTNTTLIINYGANTGRQEAGINEGYVVGKGQLAYLDTGLEGLQWCEVGDYVVFAKYAGVAVNDPETGKKYVIINDEDVLCTIQGVN